MAHVCVSEVIPTSETVYSSLRHVRDVVGSTHICECFVGFLNPLRVEDVKEGNLEIYWNDHEIVFIKDVVVPKTLRGKAPLFSGSGGVSCPSSSCNPRTVLRCCRCTTGSLHSHTRCTRT